MRYVAGAYPQNILRIMSTLSCNMIAKISNRLINYGMPGIICGNTLDGNSGRGIHPDIMIMDDFGYKPVMFKTKPSIPVHMVNKKDKGGDYEL